MHGARRTRKSQKSSGFGFAGLTNSSPEKLQGVITGVARASEAASSATTELNIRSPTGSVSSSVAEGSQTVGNPADDLVQAQSSLPRSVTGRLSSRSATSSQTASPNKTSRGSIRMASGDEDWENILNDPSSPRKQRGKRKTAVQRDSSFNEMPSPLFLAAPTNAPTGTSSTNRPQGMLLTGSQRSVSFESKSSFTSKRERSSDSGLNKSEEGNKVSISGRSKSPIVSGNAFGTSPPLSTSEDVANVTETKTPPAKESVVLKESGPSTAAAGKEKLPEFTSANLEHEPDVPAFLSGWDGATGWGDELDLDDEEDEAVGDAWLGDISSPAPQKMEENIEESIRSRTKGVGTESKEIAKPETSETFSDTSVPVMHVEESAILQPMASSIADQFGKQEVNSVETASVPEKQFGDEPAKQHTTAADMNWSDVAVDAPEMTKELPTKELPTKELPTKESQTSSTFYGFETSSEQTQSGQNAPAVLLTGEQGSKMHGDASENASETIHDAVPEPGAWPIDSAVREESGDIPKVSSGEAPSIEDEHPEVKAEQNAHYSAVVMASDTVVENSGAAWGADALDNWDIGFGKEAEPPAQEVGMDKGRGELDYVSVPYENEESTMHTRHLPSTENQDNIQKPTDVPRFGADVWTRDVSFEKSEAVEDVTRNVDEVEETGRVTIVPEAKLEAGETVLEEVPFSEFESQAADVWRERDAGSERMPSTGSAIAERNQAVPVQASTAEEPKNELAFPSSEWDWGGPVDTEATANDDFFASAGADIFSSEGTESKPVPEPQSVSERRFEDHESSVETANVRDTDQIESSLPEPVPNASSVWSIEESNPSLPQVVPSTNVPTGVKEDQSSSQAPAEGIHNSKGVFAENVATAKVDFKTQQIPESPHVAMSSAPGDSSTRPVPGADDKVAPVKAEASAETNAASTGWSWGHEDELQESPSHAISAWGHFEVGMGDEKQENGTGDNWNIDIKEELVLEDKGEPVLQSSIDISPKVEPEAEITSFAFEPAEIVDEQRTKHEPESNIANPGNDWNCGTGTDIKPERSDPFAKKDNESTETFDHVNAAAEEGRNLFVPQKPAVETRPQSQLGMDSEVRSEMTKEDERSASIMDSFAVSTSEQSPTDESFGWGWGVGVVEGEANSSSDNFGKSTTDSVSKAFSAQNDAPDRGSELPKKDLFVESVAPTDQGSSWAWSAKISTTDRNESFASAVRNVSDSVNEMRSNATASTALDEEKQGTLELRTKDLIAATAAEVTPEEQSVGWDWNSASIPKEHTFTVVYDSDSVSAQQTSISSPGQREAPIHSFVEDKENVSSATRSANLSGNSALRTGGIDYAAYIPQATTVQSTVAQAFDDDGKLAATKASQPSVPSAAYNDNSAAATTSNVDISFLNEDSYKTDTVTTNSNMFQEADQTATFVWPSVSMAPGLPRNAGNEYSAGKEDTGASGGYAVGTDHLNSDAPEVPTTGPAQHNVTAVGFNPVSSYAPIETISGTGSNVHISETVASDPFSTWATSSSIPEPVEWSLSGIGEDVKPENTFSATETPEKPSISAGTGYHSEDVPGELSRDAEDYAPASSSFVPSSEPAAAEVRGMSVPHAAPQSEFDIEGIVPNQDTSDEVWRKSAQNTTTNEETVTSTDRAENQAWNPPVLANDGIPESTDTGLQGQSDYNNFGNLAPTSSTRASGWNSSMSHHAEFPNAPVATTAPLPEYSSSDLSERHQNRRKSGQHSTSDRPSAQEIVEAANRTEVGSNTEAAHDFKSDVASGYARQFWTDKLRDPGEVSGEVSMSIDKRSHIAVESSFSGDHSSAVEQSAYPNEQKQDAGSFQTLPADFRPQGDMDNLYAPKPLVKHSVPFPRAAETQGEFHPQSMSEKSVSQERQSPYPPSPAVSSPLRSETENPGVNSVLVDEHEHSPISYAPRTISTVPAIPAPVPPVENKARNSGNSVGDRFAPQQPSVSQHAQVSQIPTSLKPMPGDSRKANVAHEFYGHAPDHGADLWSENYAVSGEEAHEKDDTGQTLGSSYAPYAPTTQQTPIAEHGGFGHDVTAEVPTDQVWSGTTLSHADAYAPYGAVEDHAEPFLRPVQNDRAFPDDAFAGHYAPAKVSAPSDSYSFPFSIMDANAPDDLLHKRTPQSLISWGFGGSLVVITPKPSTEMVMNVGSGPLNNNMTASTTVRVYDMSSVAQDSTSEDWMASLETVAALSTPSSFADLEPYAKMCDKLASYSMGSDKQGAESRSFLWRLLSVLCKNPGNNWHEQFASVLTGPVSVPLFNKSQGSSSNERVKNSPLRTTGQSDSDRASAACEVERLLCNGNRENAVQVAERAGLWSLALVISASLNRDIYMRTVSNFAKEQLSNGAALQTLCLSMSENHEELIRLSTSVGAVKNWKKTVSVLLERAVASGGRSREMHAVEKIGEALIEHMRDFPAAHICFLICGKIKALAAAGDESVGLLGADPTIPAGRPRSYGAIASVLQSMVYEAVYQVQNGEGFPHLLPFRLVVAQNLASVGRRQLALQHCEALVVSVRAILEKESIGTASQNFTLPFLSNLEALEHRLRQSLGEVQKSGASTALRSLKASLSSVFKKPSETLPPSVAAAGPPAATAYTRSHTSATTAAPIVPISTAPDPYPTPVPSQTNEVKNDPAANTWNQLVSSTVNALAPAQGDLSPPVRPRRDASLDSSGFQSSFDYRSNAQANFMHMRSASHGDVPSVMPVSGPEHPAQFWNATEISQGGIPMPSAGRGFPLAGYSEQQHAQSSMGFPSEHLQQRSLDESDARSQSSNALNDMASMPRHRRSSSDITHHESRTSEKPPRPPKRSSPRVPTDDERTGAEGGASGANAARKSSSGGWGWRNRLSEKIRSALAFGGPPRAHMGEENKFVFDKEKGRWIIPGEESEDVDDVPPPPPDDETLSSSEVNNLGDAHHPPSGPPSGGSFGSAPHPDLSNDASWKASAPLGPSLYANPTGPGHHGFNNQPPAYMGTGTISGNDSASVSAFGDNMSESSVGSAASAPGPRSRMHADVQHPVSNKYRARHKLSGVRAYVDTFNTGSTSAIAPLRPPARVTPNSVGSSPGGVKIFTPAPAPAGQGNTGFSGIRHSTSFDDTSSNASVNDMSYSASSNVQNSFPDALPPNQGPSYAESFKSDTSTSAQTFGSQLRNSEGPRRPHMRA